MEIKISEHEDALFAIKMVVTFIVLIWVGNSLSKLFQYISSESLVMVITYAIYFGIIALFVLFQKIMLIGYMKGNGICISEYQFPEVYKEYKDMLEQLGIQKEPKLFILQQGGLLNAFAIRFSGHNYIAIYSDIFSIINSDKDTLKFVIGHELGHIKRNHMSKRFWTFPSSIVPFLTPAYSRMCEYTCDNIGAALIKDDYIDGLVLLAAGKELYKRINIGNYLDEANRNYTFVVKFVNLFMSHPYLPKRIKNLNSFNYKCVRPEIENM